MTLYKKFKFLSLSICTVALISGCSAVDRLSSVGELPKQTKMESPIMKPGYEPVALPMPAPKTEERQVNSLWSGGGRKTFFEDQRADEIGDILTVMIDIKDEASLKNETTRERKGEEDASAPAALGLETYLGKVFPGPIDPTALLNIDAGAKSEGTGEIKREEEIKLQVAAIVSQILPNGNMVIHGRQEFRVNFENRILQVSGVIRPEDISIGNTISYEKIAEARVSYGGKGHLSDMQQPRYGQQIIDIISPF